MISLTPLMQHLEIKPEGFDWLWFRKIAGSSEFAQVREEALPLPACWLIRAADRVRHAGERAENVSFIFDVVIALENARTHRPGETDDKLLDYRRAVKTRLLGWEAAHDVRPIKFDGGRLLDCTDGFLYWADRYQFDALVTNYLPDPGPFETLHHAGEKP